MSHVQLQLYMLLFYDFFCTLEMTHVVWVQARVFLSIPLVYRERKTYKTLEITMVSSFTKCLIKCGMEISGLLIRE